jgi:hypothetical protein
MGWQTLVAEHVIRSRCSACCRPDPSRSGDAAARTDATPILLGREPINLPSGRLARTRVEVHGFLAGDLQRVVNAQAGRFQHIDPPGESRKPLRNRQRIIVDDIVDTRLRQSARRPSRRLRHRCERLPSYSGTEHLAPAHDVHVRPCISQGFGCMPCKKRSGLSGPMGISSNLIICALPKGSFSSIS